MSAPRSGTVQSSQRYLEVFFKTDATVPVRATDFAFRWPVSQTAILRAFKSSLNVRA